jgi:hypothetical protein
MTRAMIFLFFAGLLISLGGCSRRPHEAVAGESSTVARPADEQLARAQPPAARQPASQPPAARQPGAPQPAAAQPAAGDEPREPKSPIVRELLKRLDEIAGDGSEEESKLVRDVLLDADEELSNSLGDHSRDKILKANNKPPMIRVGTRRTTGSKAAPPAPPVVEEPAKPAAPPEGAMP